MSLLGFDRAVALAGLVAVYYTWGEANTLLSDTPGANSHLDQLAIFTAFNIVLAVGISIGCWRNPWVRRRFKPLSFDRVFVLVSFAIMVANAALNGMKMFHVAAMGHFLFVLIMLPLFAMSNYGYAKMLRGVAGR
jgi:hypothetical protein